MVRNATRAPVEVRRLTASSMSCRVICSPDGESIWNCVPLTMRSAVSQLLSQRTTSGRYCCTDSSWRRTMRLPHPAAQERCESSGASGSPVKRPQPETATDCR
jgi:hypothetical protein